jgi:hypothetical protein
MRRSSQISPAISNHSFYVVRGRQSYLKSRAFELEADTLQTPGADTPVLVGTLFTIQFEDILRFKDLFLRHWPIPKRLTTISLKASSSVL